MAEFCTILLLYPIKVVTGGDDHYNSRNSFEQMTFMGLRALILVWLCFGWGVTALAASSTLALGQLYFKNSQGAMVPLQELGQFDLDLAPKSIMRKNLERVVFVTGDTAGHSPVNAILDLMADTDMTPPPPGYRVNYAGEGEWKITVQVFRDLGIAFAGALVGIYILLVLQTSSFTMPLVIMVAIPLTMIGVMPGSPS